MTKPSVEFRDIPGFPGYRATSDGRIWSDRQKHGFLSLFLTTKGYARVSVYQMCRYFQRTVHSLVCETFHGPRPGGCYKWHAAHQNGNKLDNRASNLRWATSSDNREDCRRHGTLPIGPSHWRAKEKPCV